MKLVKLSLSLFFIIFLLFAPNNAMADKYLDTIDVFNKSDAVKPFSNKAYGYAVFPTVGKGGIGLGGAYGSGRVYKQGKISGTATLMKISIGFQLGGPNALIMSLQAEALNLTGLRLPSLSQRQHRHRQALRGQRPGQA